MPFSGFVTSTGAGSADVSGLLLPHRLLRARPPGAPSARPLFPAPAASSRRAAAGFGFFSIIMRTTRSGTFTIASVGAGSGMSTNGTSSASSRQISSDGRERLAVASVVLGPGRPGHDQRAVGRGADFTLDEPLLPPPLLLFLRLEDVVLEQERAALVLFDLGDEALAASVDFADALLERLDLLADPAELFGTGARRRATVAPEQAGPAELTELVERSGRRRAAGDAVRAPRPGPPVRRRRRATRVRGLRSARESATARRPTPGDPVRLRRPWFHLALE